MRDYCKHCNSPFSSSSGTQFICTKCSCHLFPFNHFDDDFEYYWSIYSFFRLNQKIDVNNLLNMKINPFDINHMQQNDSSNDILCDDDVQYISQSKSNYIIPENYHKLLENDQNKVSVVHLNIKACVKTLIIYKYFCRFSSIILILLVFLKLG